MSKGTIPVSYQTPELQIIKFDFEDVLEESLAVTPGAFETPEGIYF